jgi:hypothetical protein
MQVNRKKNLLYSNIKQIYAPKNILNICLPIFSDYNCTWWRLLQTHCAYYIRYKGSNTGKRARRKRERFLVSNEALPSWRPIEIFPASVWDFSVLPSYRCLILFLTNILLKVQYFPYMKYDVTHIFTSLKNDVKGTEKDI